ncbi:MAG: PTS sugar transporter subunit IIA [Victivallaceae bacterium]|nr:PTS sugar transporter subunit IIA [Victivallaceae bacterium]
MTDITNFHLHHFLAEGNIVCGLKAMDAEGAVSELISRLCHNNAGLDCDFVTAEVNAREKINPTVIAPGLAVPHARLPRLERLLVALGTSEKGIDFHCPGMPPVNVIVLILTPKDDPGLHLQVLSALAADFSNPETIATAAAQKNPENALKFLHSANVVLPQYLTARNVMNKTPITLQESDTLQKAIEVLATERYDDVPVLDPEGDVRGTVSLEDILRFSLPDHILWMEDLTAINRFQPFAEMLRDDEETKLADFMREEVISVNEDLPAIQLAKIFLLHKCRQILVLREKKLVGVVNLKEFITKIFWE